MYNIKNILTKPETLIVLISLTITLIVSSFIGIGTLLLWGNFWGGLFLGLGVQLVGFAIFNTVLLRKDEITVTKLLNEQLETISKHTLKLQCSYCKKPNVIPIRLDQENRFKCEFCNQVNGVKMQFFTTQITTPLESVLLPIGNDKDAEIRVS
jgi:hypothetical protein